MALKNIWKIQMDACISFGFLFFTFLRDFFNLNEAYGEIKLNKIVTHKKNQNMNICHH